MNLNLNNTLAEGYKSDNCEIRMLFNFSATVNIEK